jgi:hypothetical protein
VVSDAVGLPLAGWVSMLPAAAAAACCQRLMSIVLGRYGSQQVCICVVVCTPANMSPATQPTPPPHHTHTSIHSTVTQIPPPTHYTHTGICTHTHTRSSTHTCIYQVCQGQPLCQLHPQAIPVHHKVGPRQGPLQPVHPGSWHNVLQPAVPRCFLHTSNSNSISSSSRVQENRPRTQEQGNPGAAALSLQHLTVNTHQPPPPPHTHTSLSFPPYPQVSFHRLNYICLSPKRAKNSVSLKQRPPAASITCCASTSWICCRMRAGWQGAVPSWFHFLTGTHHILTAAAPPLTRSVGTLTSHAEEAPIWWL